MISKRIVKYLNLQLCRQSYPVAHGLALLSVKTAALVAVELVVCIECVLHVSLKFVFSVIIDIMSCLQ